MDEKLYYLGFSLFPGIGPALFGKLLKQFGTAKKAWEASEEGLKKIVGEKLAGELVAFKSNTNLAEEYEKYVQLGIQLVTLADKEYPERLKQIQSSAVISNEMRDLKEDKISRRARNDNGTRSNRVPFLLYVKGDVSILSAPKTIGIVGTRKITPYGKHVTDMLTRDLVDAGFVTVSGLALGVDAIAHIATVQQKGKTIAVLGCGVDCCYPRENEKVYDAILESGGAIISTFPPGMQASVGSFPARNAIVAGLSQAIVVTEGAADSGSLITANDAKKIGRPVFAVPGPITSSLSQGANSLLKNGAVAVTDARDIMEHLKIDDGEWKLEKKNPASTFYPQLSREERDIIELLETGPLHFDEIVRRIKRDSKTIGSLLSLMELKTLIKNNSDGTYSL